MPRSLASIDAQIAALEAQLAVSASAGSVQSMADGGTSVAYQSTDQIMRMLNALYALRDRLSGERPMFARGRVVGLPGGPYPQ